MKQKAALLVVALSKPAALAGPPRSQGAQAQERGTPSAESVCLLQGAGRWKESLAALRREPKQQAH